MKKNAAPVRVMMVEDSPVVRHLLMHIIEQDPRLTVAAAFSTAEEALQQLPTVRPDVISMDVRLPGMNGLDATRQIMTEFPTPIVIIAGDLEDSSLQISMNALRAGALSVVEKPVGESHGKYLDVAGTICTQLYIMSQVAVVRRRVIGGEWRSGATSSAPDVEIGPPSMVGIAASTGGPPALAKLLAGMPAEPAAPVAIVQHMGPVFMEGFASWLDSVVPQRVKLAQDQEIARPGTVYVAPGDRHLEVRPGGVLRLNASAPLRGQRPSATILFKSIAEHYGARGLGIVLTGMGEDGAEGLLELRRAGGRTIAEDQSTAVVYGMPAAAVRLGAASLSLPLNLIGPRVATMLRRDAKA
ncbi:chemotaxis-specific protein-glutamate methyltransferase CheB [Iodidimonas sp. SYSU 1G8]